MLIPENLINITVIVRDIIEIWVTIYFANYLFLEKRASGGRLLLAVIAVASVIVPIDFCIAMPILPLLTLLAETVAIKLISATKISEVLGNLMFGILVTFFPELLVTWFCMIVGISENSYLYYSLIVALLLAVVAFGVITHTSEKLSFVNKTMIAKRELVVIVSVSSMVPLVLLGKYFLWDSMMFWEGYEGTATLVAVYFVISVFLIKEFYELAKNRSELEVTNAYSEYLSGVTEELNKRDHEYKNQLNAIISIAESESDNSCERIIDFAEEIIRENNVRRKPGNIICDNAVIAAYILKMNRVAEERDINFDYRIERPFSIVNISNKDLLEIIANLLNNAFEAVSDVELDKRNVSLCIEGRKIEVINYVGKHFDENTMAKVFNAGYSTKGKGRGYGMSNVLSIVEKNGSTIDMYLKGDYLEIQIEV